MVISDAMDRFFISIATTLALSLASLPTSAQVSGRQESGDPFAAGVPERDDTKNLLPRDGRVELGEEGKPRGWRPKFYRGSEEWKAEVKPDGRKGELCFKITSEKPTDSCWLSREVEVKPHTRYDLTAWVKTEGVEAEEGAKGAVVGVYPLKKYTRALQGTNDWKKVYGRFDSGDLDKLEVMLLLGGEGAAKGTVWFSDISLHEVGSSAASVVEKQEGDEPPPPITPTYRRPSFEDPVFNPEGLTLDRDQVLALAEDIARLVVEFSEQTEVANPEFQARALGIALRLDPRNRQAVVANGQLDQGQKLKPSGKELDIGRFWKTLDEWAEKLHSEDATDDDKLLGLYLGDLARSLRPDRGFAEKFASFHPGDLSAAWARIVPPPPPPPVQKPTPDVSENKSPEPQPDEPGEEPAERPDATEKPDEVEDKERYKIANKFPLLTASLFAPVQTGGAESRAAIRKVTLSFRDFEYHTYWDESGEKTRRIPHSNQGPTEIMFDDDFYRLRDTWGEHVYPMLDRRYDGWPQRGAVDVVIPEYRENSGSCGMLAVAICFEAMARGLTLDPKVGAVGTWGEGEFRSHSHLPGIVLGYGKDWPEILIVGPGSLARLEPLAAKGLVTPFLYTQILEVSTFGEAVAIASGQAPPQVKESIEAYRAIMAVRTKMEPGALAQNRHVIDKLREVATGNPNHLSAVLMLKSSENQKPLDFDASAEMVSRLFRSLEQLAENDLEWVSPEEGLKTIEIFTERMREFKPRFDRGLDRYLARLDDSTRALTEATRLRDRSTGTALNRAENAREQVRAFRQALDMGKAAGR